MAEFVHVIRNYKRMCETCQCSECPISSQNNQSDMDCSEFTEERPDLAEQIITEWANAHPEPKVPKYPTWVEYFRDNKDYPIPEEIAKLLGIKPIK